MYSNQQKEEIERKQTNGSNKKKPNSKMINTSLTMLIIVIILNLNGLNIFMKRQEGEFGLKKNQLGMYCMVTDITK